MAIEKPFWNVDCCPVELETESAEVEAQNSHDCQSFPTDEPHYCQGKAEINQRRDKIIKSN